MPRPWYAPDEGYSAAQLNDTERANIEVVREAEAHARGHIMPGDLVFFKDKPITVAMLGKHTADEWDILELEIPALHGRVIDPAEGIDFPDEGDTATVYLWFRERYWYHPDTAGPYDAWEKRTSPVERANMDTIRVARMRQYADRVEPGMMGLLQRTPLTPAMLARNTLYELRVLRNEIYARHGRRFATPWLHEHFAREHWYEPRDDFRESEISAVEKANLALIRAREDELHASLSTAPLHEYEVDGLTEEDARKLRNEIFARHGYAFHDPELASYFTALSWYKPSSAFDESQLSEIERGNVQMLRDQEIHAKSGQRFLPVG
jgi:hypothetical protein